MLVFFIVGASLKIKLSHLHSITTYEAGPELLPDFPVYSMQDSSPANVSTLEITRFWTIYALGSSSDIITSNEV